MKKLIERLRQYSESLVSYKLGADFADAVKSAADMLEQTQAERDVLRNELCFKCGKYREAHNGACDGCRWKKAALKGGDG